VVGLGNCANQAGSARIGSDVFLAVGMGLIFRLWWGLSGAVARNFGPRASSCRHCELVRALAVVSQRHQVPFARLCLVKTPSAAETLAFGPELDTVHGMYAAVFFSSFQHSATASVTLQP